MFLKPNEEKGLSPLEVKVSMKAVSGA